MNYEFKSRLCFGGGFVLSNERRTAKKQRPENILPAERVKKTQRRKTNWAVERVQKGKRRENKPDGGKGA